jgi:hypothetical protein
VKLMADDVGSGSALGLFAASCGTPAPRAG